MVGKSAKMTPIQVQMLVDILSENSEIATGKITSSFSREDRNTKWEAVATLLNSKDLGPQKTAEQWRKSWTDLKCTTRSKAAKMELVGGSDMLNVKLTNLEKRVLQLTGDITPVKTLVGETKVLTGKLWMKKLEDDLIKTETDLIRVLKRPNQIALPDSYTRIIKTMPIETPNKKPIVENLGVKEMIDQKEDKDDTVKDDCIEVSDDGSYDDIVYDDSDDDDDVDDDVFGTKIKVPLSPPMKKKRSSSVEKTATVSNSLVSVFQKEMKTQTAILHEQREVLKDMAKSLRLIVSALHDR